MKKMLILAFAAILILTACLPVYTGSNAEKTAIALGKTQGAPEAIKSYLTQQALMTPSPTPKFSPTPTGSKYGLPFPTFPPFKLPGTQTSSNSGAEVTPTPMYVLYSVEPKKLIPYFKDAEMVFKYEPGEPPTVTGNFGRGMVLDVLEEWFYGEMLLKVSSHGWVYLEDLGMSNAKPEEVKAGMKGKTTCKYHKVFHAKDASLKHCHFIDTDKDENDPDSIIGTIPDNVNYVVVSDEVRGRTVKVRILQSYWVRESDVNKN